MQRWGDVFRRLLFLSALWGLGCGLEQDGCKNYGLQFERVFSVSKEVSMLNSTLLTHSVFNLSAEPYNVTWYTLGSDQPISNQSGWVLVVRETLWFLNVTPADAGRYVTVVRTSQQCFRQETKLVVALNLLLSQCGHPWSVGQKLTRGVTGLLSCPLKDYTSQLRSYGISHNITWYKGCEQISDGAGRFSYRDTFLYVQGVKPADQGLYICMLHFNMGGVRRSVSQAIDAEVKGDYCLLPQIREPANEVIRAELGSNVTKRCLAFVPCEGNPYVSEDMFWTVQGNIIAKSPNERIYRTRKRKQRQDGGVSIDQWLVISELKEQDLNLNYTCIVLSGRGSFNSYFTLMRKEPELLVPVGLVLGSCLLLFLLCVSVYHVFKLELVLWFRRTFPMLYSRSGPDGKLYDAYVAFPQSCSTGRTLEMKRFALHTLPQVLEEACGYSLFIPDRDSLPGEAVTDFVEENLKVSRCIILLYTASTFSHKYCSNNNMLLTISKEHLTTSKDHLTTSKDHLTTSKEHLTTSKDHLTTSKEHLTTSKEHLTNNKDHLITSKEHRDTSNKHLNTSNEHLITSKENLDLSKVHLNTSNKHLNSSKVQSDHREDPDGASLSELRPLSCEDTCGHARTQLECMAAMHRALLERSLKVILVELEELGPSDLEQLPESVRHLRQTQGAVCWWRTRGGTGTRCSWGTGNTETTLSSCVSPNCRFWKEVRYKMPVKGKRTTPPEDTALLHL